MPPPVLHNSSTHLELGIETRGLVGSLGDLVGLGLLPGRGSHLCDGRLRFQFPVDETKDDLSTSGRDEKRTKEKKPRSATGRDPFPWMLCRRSAYSLSLMGREKRPADDEQGDVKSAGLTKTPQQRGLAGSDVAVNDFLLNADRLPPDFIGDKRFSFMNLLPSHLHSPRTFSRRLFLSRLTINNHPVSPTCRTLSVSGRARATCSRRVSRVRRRSLGGYDGRKCCDRRKIGGDGAGREPLADCAL